MNKHYFPIALALAAVAANANAAVVTKSFVLTASGFESGAPVEPVSGTFSFTYDDSAFATPPAAATVSGFNLPGTALFSYNKGLNLLSVGTNITFNSYTVGPATPGFGFFITNISSSPTVSSFTYSTGSGQLWHASNISLAAPAVPEPATWAMMIGGFGLVGGAMRRRRAQYRAYPSTC